MQKENLEPFCKKCGKEIDSESNYCKYCGKKVKKEKCAVPFRVWFAVFTVVCCILIIGAFSAYCIINYQIGIAAMDNCNFISAQQRLEKIPFFQRLFQSEYRYIHAGVLMEQGEYIEALDSFRDLDYPVPHSVIDNIQEELYSIAQQDYRHREYTKAMEEFTAIRNYKRSEDYLFLIICHGSSSTLNYDKLLDLIGFEDAGEIIANSYSYFKKFTKDEWESESGDYYFKIDEKWRSSYNLPSDKISGGNYHISEGTYVVTDKNGTLKKQFKFFVVDKNTMVALCYKNNKRITLVRKNPT